LVSQVFALALRLVLADAAYGRLAPLGLSCVKTQKKCEKIPVLIERHGAPWGERLVEYWTRERYTAATWMPGLADLCEALHRRTQPECSALARTIVEREAIELLENARQALKWQPTWLDESRLADEASCIALLLATAEPLKARASMRELCSFLVDESSIKQ
jgi:hypothetical protein